MRKRSWMWLKREFRIRHKLVERYFREKNFYEPNAIATIDLRLRRISFIVQ